MGEIGEIIEHLQIEAGQDANIIWGNGFDNKLGKQISVSIIATGFNTNPNVLFQKEKPKTEYVLEVLEPEIFLDEPEDEKLLFEEKTIKMDIPPTLPTQKPKKEKKKKVEMAAENNIDSGNVDGWFHRQFTRFFEDTDVALKDE